MPTTKPTARRRSQTAPADAARDGSQCDPSRCPCDDAACSLSRYARATAAAERVGSGEYTLEATEHAVAERLQGMAIDMSAMTAVSNIYRAANAVRNHVERRVLASHDLTWTAWVVLWVVWIWGEIESRHLAAEAGISKGTLTGVQNTLINKGLLDRTVHPDDGRRALLSLTESGQRLMTDLFPKFNAEEKYVTAQLDEKAVLQMARSLRAVVKQVEEG